MGAAGTDAAPQSAEIALMSDDLARLPDATTGARQAARVMRQKRHRVARRQGRVRHPGALGLVTLVLAVAADMGMSLLVTLNGLRLLRRHAAAPAAASLTCADDSCSHA